MFRCERAARSAAHAKLPVDQLAQLFVAAVLLLTLQWQEKHIDDPFIYSYCAYLSEKWRLHVYDLNQDDGISFNL
jgi:hypothetical protein